MCQIIYIAPKVELPDVRTLLEQFEMNPHGWGFIQTGGERGFSLSRGMKFWELLRELEYSDDKAARLIHLRYATHGRIGVKNTHPFKVVDHPNAGEIFLMHNGIVEKFSDDPKKSDSKRFAEEFLHPLLTAHPSLWGSKELLDRIAAVDSKSRFALADQAGRVVLTKNFDWTEDDLIVSNIWGMYRSYRSSTTFDSKSKSYGYYDDELDELEFQAEELDENGDPVLPFDEDADDWREKAFLTESERNLLVWHATRGRN